MPLSATASLLLVLSSLSLQAAALQARSQVLAGQRLRQAEDQLMSAAQHWLAGPSLAAAQVGEVGQVDQVAYRLVALDGPHWQAGADAGADGLQRSQATATLELLPTAQQPRPLRAAFALELARPVAASPSAAVRVLAVRELGLRGRAAQGVAP